MHSSGSFCLPRALSMPFLLPVIELYKVGTTDLQRGFEGNRCEFAREPGIEALSRRFPFADPVVVAAKAKEQGLEIPSVDDATPQDLASLIARYLEDIGVWKRASGVQQLISHRCCR